MTSHNDVVDEAWEGRNAANDEGEDGTPIRSIFGRVAVDAVEVVHVGHRHVATSDNEIARARKQTN